VKSRSNTQVETGGFIKVGSCLDGQIAGVLNKNQRQLKEEVLWKKSEENDLTGVGLGRKLAENLSLVRVE
jgi:hypothetical protein